MTTLNDPLSETQALDRVYFGTGVLLDAEDFRAEQTYHRNCLAHALANLHGSGTAAGLEVEYSFTTTDKGPVEQVIVHPGLAVDRQGRLIVVPGPACRRLDQWYQSQKADDLTAAFHGSFGGVVADIFVRFITCERGKTPAFASGPFDALDAVQPSRLRDSYEISIILRREADSKLALARPDDPWATVTSVGDPAARRTALLQAILKAWPRTPEDLLPHPEYAEEQEDKTAVFLCRLAIQATQSAEAGKPPKRPDPLPANSVTIDNTLRALVYSPQALAHILDLV